MRFSILGLQNLLLFVMIVAHGGHDQLLATDEEIQEEKQEEIKTDQTDIAINFSDDPDMDSEEEYNTGFGRLFNNPALASGLSSGSALINRSIESFMEIVFYRLLDQQLQIDVTDETVFKLGVNRDVYQTPTGAYVVVDRFNLGPQYVKEIANINNIPISLGVDGKVGVFDIYLRTDGMRLAQQEELPFWRSTINNMFGLIPFLSWILPPSFNPNEMYDPANLLETPFSFPVTVGGFKTMPVGSIRSYNISGGVNLPIEFATRLTKDMRDRLSSADKLAPTLPYSIFVEGEYRINVLRRSKNIAWVGLTRVKRLGNRINAGLGRTLSLLDKIISAGWWAGLPARLFPLDAQWAKAKANIFNQLYEFDLRRTEARKAYLLAVKGDFTLAMDMHQKQVKLEAITGVSFQFTRTEHANESLQETATNLILLSSEIQNSRSESEIEVTDEQGKFYLLRATSEVDDEFTEALTGRQRDVYQNSVEMKVVRAPDPEHPDNPKAFVYKFDPEAPNPINLTLSYRVQDRYTDAHEYREYISRIRSFTGLPLQTVPAIPRREAADMEERHNRIALLDPTYDHLEPHVTPTYLGRFDSTAAMLFNSEVLNAIFAKSEDERWSVFAEAFDLKPEFWGDQANRGKFATVGAWLRYVSMRPLRVVNIRSDKADFIREASNGVTCLEEIAKADTPLDKLKAFDKLFNTTHPEKLAKALYLLSDKASVPRSVSLNTRARGGASKDVKKSFDFLRNKVYRSTVQFPPKERSRLADEKLNAFYPDEMRERRLRPIIRKIDVRLSQMTPEDFIDSYADASERLKNEFESQRDKKQIKVRVYVKNVSPAVNGKIYIRVGETGKVQLGKFLLGERVFEVKPNVATHEDPDAQLGILTFEFYLTGPLSPLRGSLYTTSFSEGGEYQVDLGLSNDGKVWSDERSFRFQYIKGRLAPPP